MISQQHIYSNVIHISFGSRDARLCHGFAWSTAIIICVARLCNGFAWSTTLMAPKIQRNAQDDFCSVVALSTGHAVKSVLESFRLNTRLSVSVETARKDARKKLYELPNTETPFGAICRTTTVQGKKGSIDVYHVNPAAFLYHALLVSTAFRELLMNCHTNGNGNYTIVLYLDEATPGNQQRPDKGRTTQCIFYSILEFPKWFISRACGWLPFGYVYATELKEADLNDSMLVRFIVKEFCKEGFDGCDFALTFTNARGGDDTYRFEVKCQVADWPQHGKTFRVKGFGGTVCCFKCANCIGRCAPFQDRVLTHFTEPDFTKFIPHTHDTILELVTHLEQTALLGNKGALRKEEKHTGFLYDADGLMFDPEVRSKMPLPQAGIIDWMHTLVASGGIAQYQVNKLVLLLGLYDIIPAEIDEWVAAITLPKGYTKLRKTFFVDRIVTKPTGHIRAFAAEMLTAIVVLDMFLDIIVAPMNIAALTDHISCFTLLACLTAILQKGDIAQVPDFRIAVRSHHIMFLQLYEDVFKTKGHALHHVADDWVFWGVLLSCFAPERTHQVMKKVMKFSYTKATKSTLAYAVNKWFDNMNLVHAFAPTHFIASVYAVDAGPVMYIRGSQARVSQWCKRLRTPLGQLAEGDLVRYSGADTQISSGFGFVVGFALFQLMNGSSVFAAVLKLCVRNAEGRLVSTNNYGLIMSDQVSAIVPYADLNGEFVPASHV